MVHSQVDTRISRKKLVSSKSSPSAARCPLFLVQLSFPVSALCRRSYDSWLSLHCPSSVCVYPSSCSPSRISVVVCVVVRSVIVPSLFCRCNLTQRTNEGTKERRNERTKERRNEATLSHSHSQGVSECVATIQRQRSSSGRAVSLASLPTHSLKSHSLTHTHSQSVSHSLTHTHSHSLTHTHSLTLTVRSGAVRCVDSLTNPKTSVLACLKVLIFIGINCVKFVCLNVA